MNLRSMIACLFMMVVCLARPCEANDAAQTTSFTVSGTTLPAGEGEAILQAFAPALAGRGLGARIEADLNPTIASLADKLQGDVLVELNKLNFVPFAKKMADGAGMTARMMPVDYATKYHLFSLTGGAIASGSTTLIEQASDISQNFNNIANGQSPDVGGSADVSVLLGINLAAFDLPRRAYFNPDRMQLFVSGMHLPIGNITTDRYGLDVWHIGVHGKYLLFDSKQLSNHFDLARWGGLAVTTGMTYASQDFAIRSDLPGGNESSQYTLAQANKTLRIDYTYAGSGVVSTHSDLHTIPVEVSTSMQLLYFLTFYAGGAVDFTWGTTSMAAHASEPVNVSLSDGTTSKTILTPNPMLAVSVAQSPTTVAGRAFFGLQVNAGVAALFAQASIDSTSTVGAAAGLRFFY